MGIPFVLTIEKVSACEPVQCSWFERCVNPDAHVRILNVYIQYVLCSSFLM